MKPPVKRLSNLPGTAAQTFAPPSPRVSRQAKGKVLTAEERAAFLASRQDLKPS